LPVKLKYSPQHSDLRNPQTTISACIRGSSHPHKQQAQQQFSYAFPISSGLLGPQESKHGTSLEVNSCLGRQEFMEVNQND
jgi:hypothetical protein